MSMDAINRFYDALDHNTRLQQQVDEIRLRHAKAAFQEFRQFAADNGFRKSSARSGKSWMFFPKRTCAGSSADPQCFRISLRPTPESRNTNAGPFNR